MISIFYINISSFLSDANYEHYLESLPYEMQFKIRKYRNLKDRKLILFGKLILRMLADEFKAQESDFLEEIEYNNYGRPYVENSNILDFNISHSGDYVVCAMSDSSKLGIDVEKIDNDIDISNFKFQMLDEEWDRINISEQKADMFYNYWTEKESVIKAEGTGLQNSLKSFIVKNNRTTLKSKLWYITKIPIDDLYKCSLTTDQLISSNEISIKELKMEDFEG